MVDFPQSHARMTVASERLHAAIVEGRLRHPSHPELNQHVADAIAKQTGRGWRLDTGDRNVQIDAAVALAMAVDRATQPCTPPARLLGWI
jgi:phage terminase large subunit-like protein